MLVEWSSGTPKDEEKSTLLKALDIPSGSYDPVWPLPNLKPSDEAEFWGWQRSYSPRARLWLGQKKIAYKWATVLAYWMGETRPSFAVAVFDDYPRPTRAVYYSWTACVHDYEVSASGNCWRDYTCTKCGVSYHEDSSG
jgi:hypothetical protein